jgi:glycosyltransferase involved in cell wall biosynthesis
VTTTAPTELRRPDAARASLAVSGVANPSSAGIWRYAVLLADALGEIDVSYDLGRRARGDATHFHLANSSRAFLRQSRTLRSPFAVTVHDVLPRTAALLPLYRRLAYPALRSAAATIVHSTFAADMLVREGGAPRRLEVIHHPARRPHLPDRMTARRTLGWPEGELIAVLPGVIKPAKLAREAVAAAAGIANLRLALTGRIADRRAAREAQGYGALILPDPDDAEYEQAIVAADCVLCLRSGTVGETNGPLLDGLGAGRAVLATATGSIPEVAGDAVHYCDGTETGIRAGLIALADDRTRVELERSAYQRAAKLTWHESAALHAELFREVFDA